jgi:hypothetical protein
MLTAWLQARPLNIMALPPSSTAIQKVALTQETAAGVP